MILGQALYAQTPASTNYILVGETYESAFGGPFELVDSTRHGYDALGRTVADTGFTWNGTAWEEEYRGQYTYVGQTQAVTEILVLYFDGSAWTNYERTVFTYDAGGHLTSVTEQYHNGMGWEDDDRTTYTITNGFTTADINEYWNGTNWEKNNRNEYTYNAQGDVTSYTSASWNGTQWENNFRETRTYNAQGLLDTSYSYFWSGASFDTSGRNVYNYNTAGMETQMISQYPDFMGSGWITLSTRTTSFNGNGQATKKVTVNIFNGTTEYIDSIAYDYDAQGNLYQESVFYANNGILEPSERYRYYYKASGNVGINNPASQLEVAVYPNPAVETLNITIAADEATVSIINLNGQVQLQQTIVAGTSQLDVTALHNGMYIVTITRGASRTSTTFIKQ